jgi:hypothetical protein
MLATLLVANKVALATRRPQLSKPPPPPIAVPIPLNSKRPATLGAIKLAEMLVIPLPANKVVRKTLQYLEAPAPSMTPPIN